MRMTRIAITTLTLFTATASAQTAPATRASATTETTTKPASRPTASAPAPAPARVADYSDPRKAVASFLTARDEADLRDALIIANTHETEINALLGVMGATLRLQQAAVAEFGVEGEKEFGISKEKLTAALHSVETAPLVMDAAAGSATITLPRDDAAGQAGGSFLVKKSGSLWKIDANSLFQLDKSASNLPEQVKNAAAIKRVTEQAIADIRSKTYGSAQDARIEYWKQSVAAIDAMKPTGTPPLRNATRP